MHCRGYPINALLCFHVESGLGSSLKKLFCKNGMAILCVTVETWFGQCLFCTYYGIFWKKNRRTLKTPVVGRCDPVCSFWFCQQCVHGVGKDGFLWSSPFWGGGGCVWGVVGTVTLLAPYFIFSNSLHIGKQGWFSLVISFFPSCLGVPCILPVY